jgi:hypothetical protein
MMSRGASLRLVTEALQPDAGGNLAAVRRRSVTDWTVPLIFANENLVGPAMFSSLAATGHLDDLPDDVREYLAFLHQHNQDRNAVVRSQGLDLLAALGQAGVETMILKGLHSLLRGLYPDVGARMVRDIDILIHREALEPALAALETLRYTVATQYLPEQHAYAEFTREGDPSAVDLHLEIVDVPHLLSARDVWPRAQAMEVDGIGFRVPSATDALLHHLIHAQVHYRGGYFWGAIELRQLMEFAVLVRQLGSQIDWDEVTHRFAAQGLETALQSYALVAERLLALPWPLPRLPSVAARAHAQRCLAQLRWPAIYTALAPWSNLRAAFAQHRLRALYPMVEGELQRCLRHAAQFIVKVRPQDFVQRLLRER